MVKEIKHEAVGLDSLTIPVVGISRTSIVQNNIDLDQSPNPIQFFTIHQ